MSEASWDGKTAADIIADVNAIIAEMPPLPDPLELFLPPDVAYFDWQGDADKEVERAFRRKDPEMVLPMLDVIARRAAVEMFALSRRP